METILGGGGVLKFPKITVGEDGCCATGAVMNSGALARSDDFHARGWRDHAVAFHACNSGVVLCLATGVPLPGRARPNHLKDRSCPSDTVRRRWISWVMGAGRLRPPPRPWQHSMVRMAAGAGRLLGRKGARLPPRRLAATGSEGRKVPRPNFERERGRTQLM